jgi:hypothetical protein
MAWWLLHEELNGTMDETYPIRENGMSGISTQKHDKSYYDFDRNNPPVYPADHPSQQFWHEDGFSLTGNPGNMSPDTITFSGTGTAAADTISFGGIGQDHISFGDDPYPTVGAFAGSRVQGGMGSDTINLSPYPHSPFKKVPELSINKTGVQKYEEDKGIADLKDYVSSTYSGHYTTKGSNVQTLDLIESVGDAESFCRSNAIKYMIRKDKQNVIY